MDSETLKERSVVEIHTHCGHFIVKVKNEKSEQSRFVAAFVANRQVFSIFSMFPEGLSGEDVEVYSKG